MRFSFPPLLTALVWGALAIPGSAQDTPDQPTEATQSASAITSQPVDQTPSNAPMLNSAQGDYILAPGDTIELTIFREPDLRSHSIIARDGTVQLPLIQEVEISGQTVREAREILRKLYGSKYLVNPQVYLNVTQFAQRKFTIIGQVARPGRYELQGGQTLNLLEAVGEAGGFTRIADRGHVLIRRKSGNETEVIKANAKKMAEGKIETILIQPGDVISIGESWY